MWFLWEEESKYLFIPNTMPIMDKRNSCPQGQLGEAMNLLVLLTWAWLISYIQTCGWLKQVCHWKTYTSDKDSVTVFLELASPLPNLQAVQSKSLCFPTKYLLFIKSEHSGGGTDESCTISEISESCMSCDLLESHHFPWFSESSEPHFIYSHDY